MNLENHGEMIIEPSARMDSKLWRTSFSMNKPTTWCKSGLVSLVSSSCLYKTQTDRKYHSLSCLVTANKANLRDLIGATGLVILLKFDPNHRFVVPCDLEIWWMALENNRAPLLYYIKLCASFQIHRWIQIGITVRKRSIWVKIFCPVWPWNLTDDIEKQ